MLSAVRMSSRIVFERRCAAVGRKSQFTNVFGSGRAAGTILYMLLGGGSTAVGFQMHLLKRFWKADVMLWAVRVNSRMGFGCTCEAVGRKSQCMGVFGKRV